MDYNPSIIKWCCLLAVPSFKNKLPTAHCRVIYIYKKEESSMSNSLNPHGTKDAAEQCETAEESLLDLGEAGAFLKEQLS